MSSGKPIQGTLDFTSGNPDGLANWQREQEALRAIIRRRWRLPVGQHVRLRLVDMEDDLVGWLELVERPAKLDGQGPLSLMLNGIAFGSDEIASCLRLD